MKNLKMTNLKTLRERLAQRSLNQNDLNNVKGGNGDSPFSFELFGRRRFKTRVSGSSSPSTPSPSKLGGFRDLGESDGDGRY